MDTTCINFKFTTNQINFRMATNKVAFTVAPIPIHFHVGHACMNINTEIPGIPAGSTGMALVADENNQPAWGAEIMHKDQIIDGGEC